MTNPQQQPSQENRALSGNALLHFRLPKIASGRRQTKLGAVKKTKKPATAPRASSRPAGNLCRVLLVVDNAPLRAEALRLYRLMELRVTEVRLELTNFETRDLPAWHRWEAATLGALLTELRTVLQELAEKRELMLDIEDERYWTGCSRLAAYRRIMQEREDIKNGVAPEEPEEDFDDDFPPGPEAPEADFPRVFGASDLPEGMTAEVFDAMSRREQNAFRQEYKAISGLYELMTGLTAPELDEVLAADRARAGGGAPPRKDARTPPGPEPSRAEAPEKSRESSRLKDLYRMLVRQLHPDVHGEQTPAEREFWHQVQDAYGTGDLERLEALYGRLQVGLKGDEHKLPVAVLQRMTRELLDTFKTLQNAVTKARRNPAWQFSLAKRREKIEARRRTELERDLRDAQGELAYLRMELETLAAKAQKPVKRRKKKGAKAARPVKSFADEDIAFQ